MMYDIEIYINISRCNIFVYNLRQPLPNWVHRNTKINEKTTGTCILHEDDSVGYRKIGFD